MSTRQEVIRLRKEAFQTIHKTISGVNKAWTTKDTNAVMPLYDAGVKQGYILAVTEANAPLAEWPYFGPKKK